MDDDCSHLFVSELFTFPFLFLSSIILSSEFVCNICSLFSTNNKINVDMPTYASLYFCLCKWIDRWLMFLLLIDIVFRSFNIKWLIIFVSIYWNIWMKERPNGVGKMTHDTQTHTHTPDTESYWLQQWPTKITICIRIHVTCVDKCEFVNMWSVFYGYRILNLHFTRLCTSNVERMLFELN